jgi:DNA-binding transcriptional ArsR family regulator
MDSATLTAMAEPNRLRIVELLRDRPCSVNEVADRLGLRQPQASKRLHTLRQAGLVASSPRAQQRIYALRPEPFEELRAWTESFERTWTDRLGRLDAHLQQMKGEQVKDATTRPTPPKRSKP